ncbi:hypothetical protein KQJ25_37445, partial [Escherichia sp. S69_ASV_4]|nr:hypothetical protein [Escherichia sp. S69_ASV_4]
SRRQRQMCIRDSNISYLGVPHSDVTTGKRRHEAYLAFCKAHKLNPVAALPGLAMKQGYENVAKVITPETTALLCATDTLALGASKYPVSYTHL